MQPTSVKNTQSQPEDSSPKAPKSLLIRRQLWFPILGLLFAFLLFLAWQVPASFSLDTAKPVTFEPDSQLRNFYPGEIAADGTHFRWGTTGASLVLPNLSASSRITLRLAALPTPAQTSGQLVINVDGKEAARFDLKPGWNEYSFNLNKKLAAPGYLELGLSAPAFVPKGDSRLLTVALNWARIETTSGFQLPESGSYLVLWLTGIALYLAAYWQRQHLGKRVGLFLSATFPLLLVLLVAFGRTEVAKFWLVLLLIAIGAASLSFILRFTSANQKSQNSGSTRTWGYLGLILFLAAFVRLYNLDMSPLGILPDEAVLGYDAYSVLKTGYDHHGEFMPLYFRAFNDYEPAVPIYLATPTIALFGLSLWAIRLPFALLGVVTVLFSYLLARELFYSAGQKAATLIGLLAVLFVAVSPWAISESRLAMPVSPLSFFFIGGFWLTLRARRKESEGQKALWSWIGAGLLSGLGAWTYPTMKLISLLFAIGTLLIFGRLFWRKRGAFLAWAGTFTLICLPFTIVMLASWAWINFRFSLISVWANQDFFGGLSLFVSNYLSHYDPLRLFFKLTGDYRAVSSSRPDLIGIVSPALSIPAVVGLIVTFTRQWRRQPAIWLLWLWFIFFPLGSALTNEDVPNEMRAMSGAGLFEILAAFGTWWLWERLKKTSPGLSRVRLAYLAAGLFGLIFIAVSAAYLQFTLVTDPVHSRDYFRSGFAEALTEAEKRLGPGGQVCVETSSQAYILVLFFKQYDPATYQAFARQNDPPRGVNYIIPRFDKYRFNCEAPQDLRPGDVALARFPKDKTQLLWQSFYPNNKREWAVLQKATS